MKAAKRMIFSAMIALALLVGMQPTTHAAGTSLELFLTDGSTTVVVDDNDLVNDSNPAVGFVSYTGQVGPYWNVSVTGVTYPALGTTASPKLDLSSVSVSSSGPAVLDIGLSALGYTFAPGGASFGIGGTTDGFVTVQAFSGGVNSYFDMTNPLGAQMMFSYGPFSGSASGAVPASPNPYPLTIFADIEHEGAGVTSFDAKLTVPEPATLLFLGFGLVGLVGVRRKFQK